jgi:hypothetical protein
MKKGKTGLIRLVWRWLDLKSEPRAFSRKINSRSRQHQVLEETIVMGAHRGLQAVMNWGFNAH